MGRLSLVDGRGANVVLVGSRQKFKGALVVTPGLDPAKVETAPLAECLLLLHPGHVVAILCMQERAFGEGLLPTLPETSGE